MPGAIVKRGERVTLRTLEREDIDVLQRGAADPEIRHLTGNAAARNRADVAETYEDDDVTVMVVCTDDSGDPDPVDVEDVRRIGIVNVAEYGRAPRLGIWLDPDVHGEGHGTEAGTLLLEYVFQSFDTPVVRAKAFEHNDASQGLLESVGFQREGRLRRDAFLDGEYRDGLMYGLLRDEWERATAPAE
jgi:RimJ/RimL family protein N-acetyltransferase